MSFFKWLLLISFILMVITAGCGFAIHFGGEEFKSAIRGHMFLGIITLVLMFVTMIGLLVKNK